MEMNKHSIDNFVNEVTGSTSLGISEECNIHSAKFLSKNEQVAIQLENKNKNTDIYLKIAYGIGIIIILIIWESFVIFFSVKQLNPCDKCVYKISDPVFITLLTTATTNILALPTIILRYLFPRKKQ